MACWDLFHNQDVGKLGNWLMMSFSFVRSGDWLSIENKEKIITNLVMKNNYPDFFGCAHGSQLTDMSNRTCSDGWQITILKPVSTALVAASKSEVSWLKR